MQISSDVSRYSGRLQLLLELTQRTVEKAQKIEKGDFVFNQFGINFRRTNGTASEGVRRITLADPRGFVSISDPRRATLGPVTGF